MRQLWLLPTGLALLLTACATSGPHSDPTSCATRLFTINRDFPGAHSGSCTVTGPAAITLHIAPEDPPPINNSAWYAFEIQPNASGRAHVTLSYAGGSHRYQPKIRDEADQWQTLPSSAVTVSQDSSSAVINLDLDQRPIQVAGQELLTTQSIGHWFGGAAQALDMQPHVLGQSAQGRPIEVLDTAPVAREVLLLVGRQHPPEVTGTLGLQAFYEALLDRSPLAVRFRNRYAIITVPLLNPDGVDGGYWRHNTGGVDLNRDWGPFTQPETQLIKNLIDQVVDDGRAIRVFLDFHSTQRNLFYTQSDADVTVPADFAARWLDAARPQVPYYDFTQEKRPNNGRPTSKNYMYARFGIPAITYEMGDETDRQAIARSARVFARELMKLMLATPEREYEQPLYDTLIVNGTVYDGSVQPPSSTNIGIVRGRIASTNAPADALARRTIDASGRAVLPGFIDPHTHSLQELKHPDRKANYNYQSQGVTTVFVGNDGRGVPERQQTLELLETAGTGTHVAFLAGHGGIRQQVMGLAAQPPNPLQLEQMATRVAQEMQAGAFGLSTGLFYAPGSYSQTAEVVALARVASAHGGLYDTHMRVESTHDAGLMAAIEEVLTIAEQADIPVHIAHIKALGTDSWGMSEAIIARVEQALSDGLRVTADQYPWQASGTRFSNALIPRRIMADSRQAMRKRLADPALLREIRSDMLANLRLRGGPDAMLVTGSKSPFRGKTLSEIANAMQSDALTAAIAVVLDGDPPIASFVMNADDIHALAVQPWVMTGSDGSRGHPRKYATYPEAYRAFVLENKLLSTAQWVHRSSGLVADTFGLCNRGYLKEGYNADLAIINLDTYRPLANYQNPTTISPGVDHLLVAGTSVIDGANAVAAFPGQVIRKNRQTCGPTADN